MQSYLDTTEEQARKISDKGLNEMYIGYGELNNGFVNVIWFDFAKINRKLEMHFRYTQNILWSEWLRCSICYTSVR